MSDMDSMMPELTLNAEAEFINWLYGFLIFTPRSCS